MLYYHQLFSRRAYGGIAINGFGRIGRNALRAGWGREGFSVVAINDLTDAATLAYLLKHDTNYGLWDVEIVAGKSMLIIDGKDSRVCGEGPGEVAVEEIKS